MHWNAIRQLSDLVDGALDPATEGPVREHVAECHRCRHRLRELEFGDVLMRRLPRELAPLEWNLDAHARLRSAAGNVAPEIAAADGMAFRALLATTSMCLVLLLITVGLDRRRPHMGNGLLASAQRESILLASSYEPAAAWHRN